MTMTKVRERVTHQLGIGVTVDSKTKHKYVHCAYPDGELFFGPDSETRHHPGTHLSVSMQDDIVWTSDHPFKIELKPELDATALFLRWLPWIAVKGAHDGLYRVHSGALDPRALHFLKERKRLKFTATMLLASGEVDLKVDPLDPHIIIEP